MPFSQRFKCLTQSTLRTELQAVYSGIMVLLTAAQQDPPLPAGLRSGFPACVLQASGLPRSTGGCIWPMSSEHALPSTMRCCCGSENSAAKLPSGILPSQRVSPRRAVSVVEATCLGSRCLWGCPLMRALMENVPGLSSSYWWGLRELCGKRDPPLWDVGF